MIGSGNRKSFLYCAEITMCVQAKLQILPVWQMFNRC